MKISYTEKISEIDHPVIIVSDKAKKIVPSLSIFDKEMINIVQEFLQEKKSSASTFKTLSFRNKSRINYVTVARCKTKIDSSTKLEFSGQLLSYLEKEKTKNISLLFIEDKDFKLEEFFNDIVCGFLLKDYRFEKYKTISKKDHKILSLKLVNKINSSQKKNLENQILSLKGTFLTRDLVSEPANILYPEKFVEYCNVMKKAGVQIEVFDEKKLKKIGMNALLGVAQGSVRPARVMIFKWNGDKSAKKKPLAFIGKGVTITAPVKVAKSTINLG